VFHWSDVSQAIVLPASVERLPSSDIPSFDGCHVSLIQFLQVRQYLLFASPYHDEALM
jgi:hypothetical protein